MFEISWNKYNNIEYRETENAPILSFRALDYPELVQGFSTKLGGVSKGEWESMNLSFSRGDNPEDVEENFKIFASSLGCSSQDFVLTDQVHDTKILRVGKKDCGEVFYKERMIRGIDGLVTDEPGVVLLTFFADCVPLLFYDPVHHAIGNAHSGWRGTVGRMGEKMVRRMEQEFGSKPEDIIGVVGPSICQSCYEVSEDVILEFQKNFEKKDWSSLYYEKENGHYQLDLWKANQIIMRESGLLLEHIYCSDLCTNCHPDLLFSHRYTGGKRGNLAAAIGLK